MGRAAKAGALVLIVGLAVAAGVNLYRDYNRPRALITWYYTAPELARGTFTNIGHVPLARPVVEAQISAPKTAAGFLVGTNTSLVRAEAKHPERPGFDPVTLQPGEKAEIMLFADYNRYERVSAYTRSGPEPTALREAIVLKEEVRPAGNIQ